MTLPYSLAARRNIVTVSVEDYFQGPAFAELIDQRHWPRFVSHIEQNTAAALSLLERHGATATFFVPAWVAERHRDLVREITRRGHEAAAAGLSGKTFRGAGRAALIDDAKRTRDLIEAAGGQRVRGFRAADHLLGPSDLWGLEALAEAGYEYDSSLHPSARRFSHQPWRRFIHRHHSRGHAIWEVPLSSVRALGFDLPVAGGNWFRQLPEAVLRHLVERWTEATDQPFVMYFRVWDLDETEPAVTGAPRLSRIRHYRNPGKVPKLIDAFLSAGQFTSISEHLGIEAKEAPVPMPSRSAAAAVTIGSRARTPVSVVIPCYNEQSALPYLSNALKELACHPRYEFRFVFVDDGSRDDTVRLLNELFGSLPGVKVIRHPVNRGVAAAIMTGIKASDTEVVCSMDCDCTYDPNELAVMIPMLGPTVDLVTASPYHPQGAVLRVPAWRLSLSKGASALYRVVLRHRLHTYTSCFRVYRRTAFCDLELSSHGFLGVAEMLGLLDLRGGKIVEYPAVLSVRMLGRSKMRVLRTIAGHLGLLARFALMRMSKPTRPIGGVFQPAVYASKGLDRE